VVDCGRRWGKTVLGTDRIIHPALQGYPVGWFAPEYKYLTEVWDTINRRLKPIIEQSNKSEGRIRLTTGGVVEFWSLKDNPDAGRSRKYKHIVVDEAAMCKALETAWNKAIRPTLTDLRGSADFLSTPKGMNFFAAAYQWGQDGKPGWKSWRMPTSTNPHVPLEEIEEQRATLPERVFAQEFEATFLEDAGGVFRGVREAVDKGRKANEAPSDSLTYTLGIDLARTEDFTVLSIFSSDARQVYFERFNQISWERQLDRIETVCRQYSATAYVDSTGLGDPLFERLRKTGINVRGYTLTNASKENLIDNLAIRIEKGEVKLLDHDVQTTELLAYQYELTQARNVRMGAPDGMHDDTVIALALAAWGLGRRRTMRINTSVDVQRHDKEDD